MKYIRIITIALLLLALSSRLMAQIDNENLNSQYLTGQLENPRIIMTGVPILSIAPDARSGAMGDVGVASSPDASSIHWNAAKLAFVEDKAGVNFTYTPWLREIIDDISLLYLAGYYKIDDRSAVGMGLTYFSLGGINFTGHDGGDLGTYNPNEFALDMAYTMKLSEKLSASVTGRYVRSDLTQGQSVGTTQTKAANAVGADMGIYYQSPIDESSEIAFGGLISNLGSKLSYSDGMDKSFLPANLRVGGRYSMEFDEFNKLSVMLDFNKLLVPTPPVYDVDTNGNPIYGQIFRGMDPNVGSLQGAIQSFYDAPNGFKEELQEVMISFGLEYTYSQYFHLRGGYFYESAMKGNRKYISLGGGFKYNVMSVDFAYLIPTSSSNHPLKNTLRIGLSFDLGGALNLKDIPEDEE